jgi:hypothetical protein
MEREVRMATEGRFKKPFVEMLANFRSNPDCRPLPITE